MREGGTQSRVDSKMCDPTTKMCVAGTTTDTPQISFSGANVAENTSGSGASEAQPISMSRNEEELNVTDINTLNFLVSHFPVGLGTSTLSIKPVLGAFYLVQ